MIFSVCLNPFHRNRPRRAWIDAAAKVTSAQAAIAVVGATPASAWLDPWQSAVGGAAPKTPRTNRRPLYSNSSGNKSDGFRG